MALVKFGGGVTEFRGTLAGNIFSRNKGGAYVKKFTIPTNPQTQAQLAIRAIFSQISTAWSGLTQAQRDGWIARAATIPFENSVGDEYFLSGKGLFQKVNTVTLSVEEAVFENIPGDSVVPDTVAEYTIAASVGAQSIILTSDTANIPADRKYVTDGAPQSTAAKVNNNSLFKRVGFSDEAAIWDTLDIGGPYIALYGALILGQRIEVRSFAFDKLNGMFSPFIKANTIVAA